MPQCYHFRREPVLYIARNGVEHWGTRCADCKRNRESQRDRPPGWLICEVIDARAEAAPCERCGSENGTELHHWAPQHLFDDAWEWPTSYLCRPCHTLWHRIVTPAMAKSA